MAALLASWHSAPLKVALEASRVSSVASGSRRAGGDGWCCGHYLARARPPPLLVRVPVSWCQSGGGGGSSKSASLQQLLDVSNVSPNRALQCSGVPDFTARSPLPSLLPPPPPPRPIDR